MGNKILAIIPARKGSKGLKEKNTRFLAGKPMICWTIDAARESACFDQIIVSSDDENVLEIASKYSSEVIASLRDSNLGLDYVPGVDVAIDVIKNNTCEYGVFLQPTSPLRTESDIREICNKGLEEKELSIVSLSKVDKTPNWMFRLDKKNNTLEQYEKTEVIPIRQNTPELYQLNGALYFFNSEWLRRKKKFIAQETKGFLMPKNRSVDVDTIEDFWLAEKILTERVKVKSNR